MHDRIFRKDKENIIMTNELVDILKPLLEKGSDGIIAAAEVLREQAPVLVNQIVRYEIVSDIITINIAIVCFWVIIKYMGNIRELVYKSFDDKDNANMTRQLASFIAIALLCVCAGTVVVNIFYLLKATIAPNVFVTEYVRNLLYYSTGTTL
jgi:uncharacterized BrkB/YihY/UPF0761 family membrane protein